MNYELMGKYNLKTHDEYFRWYADTLPTVQDGILSIVSGYDKTDMERKAIAFVTKVNKSNYHGDKQNYTVLIPTELPAKASTTYEECTAQMARPITHEEAKEITREWSRKRFIGPTYVGAFAISTFPWALFLMNMVFHDAWFGALFFASVIGAFSTYLFVHLPFEQFYKEGVVL